MKLSHEALQVIRAARADGRKIFLPPDPLNRTVYEEVNEVLQRLGGHWRGGKVRAHLFDAYDPAPLLAAVQASGIMPPKNPTAFFPTPTNLVQTMVSECGISGYERDLRVLEPSAGTGAIADSMRAAWPAAQVDVCEVLDLNRAVLEAKGHRVVADDFLNYTPDQLYDAILMNPPFSLECDATAWITHLNHAWGMLKDGGKLVCITPPSLHDRNDAKHQAARKLCYEHGDSVNIPAKAFRASGTDIATCMVFLSKDDDKVWKWREYNGWPNWYLWLLFLYKDNEKEHTDAYNNLLERAAAEGVTEAIRTDALRFLGSIVRYAANHHEWIEWDEDIQALALARFTHEAWAEAQGCENVSQEMIEMPAAALEQSSIFDLIGDAHA